MGEGRMGKVRLEGQDQGLAPGQYAAFYCGSVCLGSGIIVDPPPAASPDEEGAPGRGRGNELE